MKQKYVLSFFMLSCFILSCTNNNVKSNQFILNHQESVDYEFTANFFNCIQIVTMRQVGFHANFDNISIAHTCLDVITKVESNVVSGNDTPYFYHEDTLMKYQQYFFEDVKKWTKWYEKNKFQMNMKIADSLLNHYSMTYGDTISWPKLYTEIEFVSDFD